MRAAQARAWGRDKGLLDFGGVPLIVHTAQLIEPLAAVYRRECGGPIAPAFARGARKVTDVIEELRVHVVDQREWRRLDPRAPVLRKMNTPEDYDEAQKWWASRGCTKANLFKSPTGAEAKIATWYSSKRTTNLRLRRNRMGANPIRAHVV